MARNIPLDKPLSDKDRQYLLDRGREGTVERLDQEFGVDTGEEPAGDEIRYEDWTVPELKDELTSRKLSIEGKKPELVQRLYEDDREG